MLSKLQNTSVQEGRNGGEKENKKKSRYKPKSPRSVRRVAMDCLARREHPFFELKQKLQIKLPDKNNAEILSELEKLREQNLQSDKRFAESFVRYRKSRGFGYLHIREDLRRRFVSEDLIGQILIDDDQDWMVMIHDIVIKRLSQTKPVRFGSLEHQKIERFLRSRGFQHFLSRKVLAKFVH